MITGVVTRLIHSFIVVRLQLCLHYYRAYANILTGHPDNTGKNGQNKHLTIKRGNTMQATNIRTLSTVTPSAAIIARRIRNSKAARLNRVQHIKNILCGVTFLAVVILSGFCN